MSRDKMPARRPSITYRFKHDQRPYYMTVGYRDLAGTQPGEVFLSTGKTGTELQHLMRDAAIAGSLALQYGCPPEVLAAALSHNEQGEPETAIGRAFQIITGGAG